MSDYDKEIEEAGWEDYRKRAIESFLGSVEVAHKDGFKAGANWQKQKDAEILDKAMSLIKKTYSCQNSDVETNLFKELEDFIHDYKLKEASEG